MWGLLLPYRAAGLGRDRRSPSPRSRSSLVHYDEKPSGVNVLGGSAPTSVWDLSRAQVLGRFLHPGEREVVAALERQAQKGDTIALAIRREDVSYPYFGSRLDRRVVFTGTRGRLGQTPAGAMWLVVAPGVSLGPPESQGASFFRGQWQAATAGACTGTR